MTSKEYIVIASPPTPNGNLHLGHMSGPYLSADILTRFLRLHNNNVYFASNIDSYQSYLVTKAEEKKQIVEVLHDEYKSKIKSSISDYSINVDSMDSPSSKKNVFIRNIFKKLFENNILVEKETLEPYCEDKKRFLHDAYISGNCPSCYSSTKGNICEKCGHPNEPKKLLNQKVTNFQDNTISYKPLTRLYFPLEKYRQQLKKYYFQENRCYLRPNLANLLNEILSNKLEDFPITQAGEWGNKVQIKNYENQILNPWAEIIFTFIYDITLNCGENYIQKTENEIIQFYGFDNSFFFAILHVALLMALDSKIQLPKAQINNEFLLLENQKFSSSKNHAIWADQASKNYNTDFLRIYLSYINPEYNQSNFVESEFLNLIEKKFVIPVENILNIHNNLVSEKDILYLNPAKKEFLIIIDFYKKRINSYLYPENFSIREAANNLFKLINEMSIYISNEKNLSNTWIFLSSLTELIYPIMPNFAIKLNKYLSKNNNILLDSSRDYFNAKLSYIPVESILEVMNVKQKVA